MIAHLKVDSTMKKILILSANPMNTDRLRLDEEVREIQAALERGKNQEQFEIITRWAVRVDDLQQILLDYKPTIVHFSGHGAGSDGLALENNAGKMQLVSTESLAGLFKFFQETTECILLNACYSEEQAKAIHQYIDCVIGMNQTIKDSAALNFAKGFYVALGSGKSYDDAFAFGCNKIDLNGIPESSVPVIKIRKRPNNSASSSETSHKPQKQNSVHTYDEQVNIMPNNPGGISQNVSGSQVYGGMQAATGSGNQMTQTNYTAAHTDEKPLTPSDVVSLLAQIEQLVKGAGLPEETVEEVTAYLIAAKKAIAKEHPNKELAKVNLKGMAETLLTTSKTVASAKSLWENIKPILMQLPTWLGVAKNYFGL